MIAPGDLVRFSAFRPADAKPFALVSMIAVETSEGDNRTFYRTTVINTALTGRARVVQFHCFCDDEEMKLIVSGRSETLRRS